MTHGNYIYIYIFTPEQETCVYTTVKNLNSHQSIIDKIEIVQNMLIELLSSHKIFKNLYDKDINLQRHIPASCVKYMVILIDKIIYKN